jgi:hypothetical protein
MPFDENGYRTWRCLSCGAEGQGDLPTSHLPCHISWQRRLFWTCALCAETGEGEVPDRHAHPERSTT